MYSLWLCKGSWYFNLHHSCVLEGLFEKSLWIGHGPAGLEKSEKWKRGRRLKGREIWAKERDGESFSALSGWNNWHFMWKDMGSHFTLITLFSSLLVSVLSIHLPHNWLEFEQISVELFQRPVTQEPKECLWVTDGDRDAYMLMFNKPTKILSNGQFLLA